jgi:hypothetical protein
MLAQNAGTAQSQTETRKVLMQLRRRWGKWLAVVIVGVGVLVLGITQAAGAVLAATPGTGARCSLATFNGTYIMNTQGIEIGGATPGPFAYAAISVYDGKGCTQGTFSGSFNGVIVRNQFGTGTYTVNADCTVTETDNLGGGAFAHYDGFLSPDGNLITFVETDTGMIVSAIMHRVPPHSHGD